MGALPFGVPISLAAIYKSLVLASSSGILNQPN